MVKKVRNNASVRSTALGGVSGIPSAWRRNDRVTMIRVNEVIATSATGMRLRSDSPMSNRRYGDKSPCGALLRSNIPAAATWLLPAAHVRAGATIIAAAIQPLAFIELRL